MKTASKSNKSKTNAAALDRHSAPVELQALSPAILASYAIAMCVVAFAYSVITNHVWEDSMITLRLAENLVNGNGLTYHVGTRVHTFTSPINVLLQALCYLITGKGSYVATIWAYRVFSIAAFAGSGVLLLKSVAKATPRWPLALWWLAIVYMFDGKSVAFSCNGMETAFLLLFVAWAFYLLASSDAARWLARGLCWAGLMWSRPDGCVYIAAFICAELLYSGIDRKVLLTSFAKSAVVGAIFYGPWFLWAWSYYGTPVPNTVLAKSNPSGSIAEFWDAVDHFPEKTLTIANEIFRHIQSSFGFLLDNNASRRLSDLTTKGLAIICLIYWMFPVNDRLGKTASFCFTFLCLYFTYQATPMGWYYPPATMLGLVTLARAATTLVTGPVLASRRSLVRATVVVLLIFTAVGQTAVFALTTAEMKIQQQEIEVGTRTQVGLWLREHGKPTDTVYLEPLGYIGYFSGMTMDDYPGLASPRVVKLRHEKLLDWASIIGELKTDWVVLRPYEYQVILRTQNGDSFKSNYELVQDFSAVERLNKYSFLPRAGYIYFDATFIIFHRKSQPT